jgi:hypothetical protein
MVDGRWLMRGGRLLTIDEQALYARARRMRAAMDERVQAQFRNTAAIKQPLREGYLRTARMAWSARDGLREP